MSATGPATWLGEASADELELTGAADEIGALVVLDFTEEAAELTVLEVDLAEEIDEL